MTREEVTVQLGIDASRMRAGAGEARSEISSLASGAQHAFEKFSPEKVLSKSIGKLIRPTLFFFVQSLKDGLHEFFNWFTAKLGDMFYGNTIMEIQGKGLDKLRSAFRKANEERWSQEKKIAEMVKQNDKERIELLKLQNELIKASADLRFEELGGEQSARARQVRTELLDQEKALAEIAVFQAQKGGDKKKLAEAELALEKAKLAVLKDQQATEAITRREKQKASDALGTFSAVRAPLDAINQKILNDAAMLRAYDNPSTRSQFNFDLQQRQRILSDIINQNRKQTAGTSPAQQLTDAMLGQLVQSGAIKVQVTNVD